MLLSLLIFGFSFAENFPTFPMTIYWEIKIGDSPLEGWELNVYNSLNEELTTYNITEEWKYWSDNVSKLPLLLNDFEWNLTFKVLYNWKTYIVDSIDDSYRKDTCPNGSAITFISDNCRYNISLKEEIEENDTWSTDTWNWNNQSSHRWTSIKNNDNQDSEWEHNAADSLDNTPINDDYLDNNQISNNDEDLQENWFTKEFNDAYQFSHKNWITTKNKIENADMKWYLTRIETAKMLSQYAMNILWKEPDVSKWVLKYNDVTNELNEKYNNAITLAYQLWIMWQNIESGKFRPYDRITRAEFGTALSRLLYWIENWRDFYYTTHLSKLKNEWIIKDTNPKLKEIRWYAMLMLMRASSKNNS